MINKADQLLPMALENDKTGHCLESLVGEVHSKVPYCLHRYNWLPVCDNVRPPKDNVQRVQNNWTQFLMHLSTRCLMVETDCAHGPMSHIFSSWLSTTTPSWRGKAYLATMVSSSYIHTCLHTYTRSLHITSHCCMGLLIKQKSIYHMCIRIHRWSLYLSIGLSAH